jgi:hypothetical protein
VRLSLQEEENHLAQMLAKLESDEKKAGEKKAAAAEKKAAKK